MKENEILGGRVLTGVLSFVSARNVADEEGAAVEGELVVFGELLVAEEDDLVVVAPVDHQVDARVVHLARQPHVVAGQKLKVLLFRHKLGFDDALIILKKKLFIYLNFFYIFLNNFFISFKIFKKIKFLCNFLIFFSN